jgi:hypothetical protein
VSLRRLRDKGPLVSDSRVDSGMPVEVEVVSALDEVFEVDVTFIRN